MTNSNDDYQSINESYEMMIEFPSILKNNLDTMSEADIIDFYKYVVRTMNYPRDIRVIMDEIRDILEELPIVQAYIEELEKNKELGPDDERLIMEAVKIVEKRRKDKNNIFKRFIKTFRQ